MTAPTVAQHESHLVRIERCAIDSLRIALQLVNEARDQGRVIALGKSGNLLDAAAINLDRIMEDYANEAEWAAKDRGDA